MKVCELIERLKRQDPLQEVIFEVKRGDHWECFVIEYCSTDSAWNGNQTTKLRTSQ